MNKVELWWCSNCQRVVGYGPCEKCGATKPATCDMAAQEYVAAEREAIQNENKHV